MILQNMTPQEKVAQMEKLRPSLISCAREWVDRPYNSKLLFKKTKSFPSFYIFEKEIDGMGRWSIVISIESKSLMRKEYYGISAYQTYFISGGKDESNNGIGLYLFSVYDYNIDLSKCEEFPPHYFNQFRKRFIESRGLVQPSFSDLIKIVLRELSESVNEIHKAGDDGIKPGYDNFINYSKNGISLGLSCVDGRYSNYTTYISKEMLKDNQLMAQTENLRNLSLSGFWHKVNNDPLEMWNSYDYCFKKRME